MRHCPPHAIVELHMDFHSHLSHRGCKHIGTYFRLDIESTMHVGIVLLCSRRCHLCPCHGAETEAWGCALMRGDCDNLLRRAIHLHIHAWMQVRRSVDVYAMARTHVSDARTIVHCPCSCSCSSERISRMQDVTQCEDMHTERRHSIMKVGGKTNATISCTLHL